MDVRLQIGVLLVQQDCGDLFIAKFGKVLIAGFFGED